MICEYCNTEFKTKSALNNHKNKAKYCLIFQGKIELKEKIFKCDLCEKILSTKQNLEVHKEKCVIKCVIKKVEEIFQCKYCNKLLSTKRNLEGHINVCLEKKDKELKELKELKERTEKELKELKERTERIEKELKERTEKELKELRENNIKIITQNENYREQIEKQEEKYKAQKLQIKDLQDKLEKLASKAINRPTTIVSNTTTNNHLNICTSMDFNDINKIKDIIDNNLNINHVVDGQKGIALFVKENILTDENGNSKYICTDPSRSIFKYKDINGEIKKDVEAKKLTDCIIKGGIRTRSAFIGNEWVHKEDNSNKYVSKLEMMIEFQENISKISDNNNNFKKELASIIG